jgi:hypothetical protein
VEASDGASAIAIESSWYKAPVSQFLGGFLAASLLWGGFLYAHLTGLIDINLDSEAEDAAADEVVEDEGDEAEGGKRKKKWRPGKRKKRLRGDALTGDELGGPDARDLDLEGAGGEEQLTGHEIEKGFDSVFPKVRRCLLLAADDEPVTGKIVFGLRVAGSGQVTKVNLRGPSAITKSEAGECMRQAARAIDFRSFDGPDMLVHFPLTLE